MENSPPIPTKNNVDWNRTIDRTELLKGNPLYEEPTGESKLGDTPGNPSALYGIYKKRHVIGRDEKINGGVYLGAGEREEIVVDDMDEKASKYYQKAYDLLMKNVNSRQRKQRKNKQDDGFKNDILTDVYDTVLSAIQYDKEYANDLAEKYKNEKIDLSYYINDGKGVCRHQALLVGYLLERLKNEGQINGAVSIDRNSIKGVGAHAWVRYQSGTNNAIYIIDPAQGYVGLLSEATNNWPYERPKGSLS